MKRPNRDDYKLDNLFDVCRYASDLEKYIEANETPIIPSYPTQGIKDGLLIVCNCLPCDKCGCMN